MHAVNFLFNKKKNQSIQGCTYNVCWACHNCQKGTSFSKKKKSKGCLNIFLIPKIPYSNVAIGRSNC